MSSAQHEQKLFDQYRQMRFNDQPVHLGCFLAMAAQRQPDKVALICGHTSITFYQLYGRAVMLSHVLREHGVKKNDRVLLCFENSIEFYIGYYAIVQLGAVVAPLNTFLKDQELQHILHDAKPALIVASTELAEKLRGIEGELPTIITELYMAKTVDEDVVKNFTVVPQEQDAMAALLYTSGTTGLPKGVMLSSRNIVTNVAQVLALFHPTDEDRLFGVLPLFHSFAQNLCVWIAMFIGCTVIVVPRIDRRSIVQHLEYDPTLFMGVPALYGLLCLMRTARLHKVRVFVCGGDALPDRIRTAFALLYGRLICIGYGLTEASPVISAELIDDAFRVGSAGRPLPGVACAFKDEQGNDVPQGKIGELVVKGDNVMMGYYNSPQETEKVIKDGWLYTGDLAYQDAQGRLVFTGRIKDLIINKGLNIYPQEIENVISQHPNVLHVGVIGRKDETQGEVPVAYVQLRTAEEGAEKALKALCRDNLAAYKVPRVFVCSTKPLSTTATGKVDKKVLRKLDEQQS